MTEPSADDAELLRAIDEDPDLAEEARSLREFESALRGAAAVPAPDDLVDRIVARGAGTPDRIDAPGNGRRKARRWIAALAAAAVVAMAVGIATVIPTRDAVRPADLHEYLATHWQMDGPLALATAMAEPAPEPEDLRGLLGSFGLEMQASLLERVELGKICPTPDGAGVHIVLATEQGPVTIFYMPRTRVAGAPIRFELTRDIESWVVNLERGSMALVSAAGPDMPELAREINRQLTFQPGARL